MAGQSWDIFWNYTKRYFRICFIYIPLVLVPIFLFLDYLPHRREISFALTLRHSVYYIYLFVGILFCLYTIARAAITHPYTQTRWFHAIVMALMVVIGIGVAEYLQPYLLPQILPFSKALPSSFFAMPFIVMIIFFYFTSRYYDAKYRQLKIATLEAQYATLKNQLQPHFLLNSLHSLSILMEENPSRGSLMAEKLSDLYREILNNSKSSMSTLGSEISIVEKYLELEKLRFEDRLIVQIHVEPNLENILVPSLMLQTLVENAIKHGISKLIKGGVVRLEVSKDNENMYFFKLSNTGKPYDPKAKIGTGLANTKERLQLLAGKNHRFHIEPLGDKGTLVTFYLPELRGGDLEEGEQNG